MPLSPQGENKDKFSGGKEGCCGHCMVMTCVQCVTGKCNGVGEGRSFPPCPCHNLRDKRAPAGTITMMCIGSSVGCSFFITQPLRTDIRNKFGLKADPMDDFWVHFCCQPCAICQVSDTISACYLPNLPDLAAPNPSRRRGSSSSRSRGWRVGPPPGVQ